MCVGSSQGNSFSPFGRLLGVNQPSPYANNYGYAKAGGASSIDAGERQWYIDNGFGDPLATTGATPARKGGFWMTTGRNSSYIKPVAANPGYYKGVSAEARYLYTTAADRAKAIADASGEVAQQRANASNVRVRDQGVTYNYAGNALAIPGS